MTDVCRICHEEVFSQAIQANDARFHSECFLCNCCLRPFPGGAFLQAEDSHLYCEDDYYKLFGDRCARCGDLISERLIDALDQKWHAEHFTCDSCGKPLAGGSFVKRGDRPYCKECNQRLKAQEAQQVRAECVRCKKPIMAEDETIVVDDEKVHAYHYTCALCKKQLKPDYKKHQGQLYCPEDFARATAPSCYVCKRPIYGRVMTAMSKSFHPEHFVCSKCEQPFSSSSFWEYQGRPYCEAHYNELASAKCSRCYDYTKGKVIPMMGKKWCENHFTCFGCDTNLAKEGGKFLPTDDKPYCLRCYEMLPSGTRKRLYNYNEIDKKANKR